MNSYLPLKQNFTYHVLHVDLIALGDTLLDAWPGAVIRNNLLYAARQVEVENGDNLYSRIEALPLASDHPFYKEMVGGHPRGFVILPLSHTTIGHHSFKIKKHGHFRFSLVLIGSFARYHAAFIRAISLMCERGFGKPMQAFQLLEVEEVREDETPLTLYMPARPEIAPLQLPYSLDFLSEASGSASSLLEIEYTVPTLLYTPKAKKDRKTSYQDKMNGFPSFYQLVRSVCYRIIKLYALYVAPEETAFCREMETTIEAYLDAAARVTLLDADLRMIVMRSTLKKEESERIKLPGYIGRLLFEGNFAPYLRLLHFASNLGVGKDTSYGLGKFEIGEL